VQLGRRGKKKKIFFSLPPAGEDEPAVHLGGTEENLPEHRERKEREKNML
jgi:hypothetical protein